MKLPVSLDEGALAVDHIVEEEIPPEPEVEIEYDDSSVFKYMCEPGNVQTIVPS